MQWVPKGTCTVSQCSSDPCSPEDCKRKKRYVPTIPVCKFYNSYFEEGCVHGENCAFRHLNQDEFSDYCRKLALRKPLTTREVHRYKDAQRHFRDSRFQTARKIFGALCSKYPFHAELSIWLARTHDKVSMHSDKMSNVGCAGYYYRRAIAIDPHNAYFHGRYASSAYWFGDYMECKKHFVRSLKLKDDSADVHRDYGHYLQHIEGRLDLAEQHYLKCLALYAKDQDCHYFYANLLVQKKRYQEAQTHFLMTFKCQQYQRGGKRNGRFHLAFARCLDKMENYEMAQRQYLVCLSLNKFDSVVHLELGQLQCEQLDDYKEGLKHIRTSMNIEFQESTKHILERLEKRYDAKVEATKREKEARGATHDVQAALRSSPRRRRNVETAGATYTPGATYCVEGAPSTRTTPSSENKPKQSKWMDDDDEKAQTLNLKEDALKIAQRIRESESERFILSQSYLDEKVRAEYLNEFKRRKLNDIILLKIDTNAFVDELGIRNLVHSTLLKKRIERFKTEMDAFNDWLIRLRMEETLGVFEKYGILTFEQFDHHIKSEDDLRWLLGAAMGKHAQVIWNANSLFRARSHRAYAIAANS